MRIRLITRGFAGGQIVFCDHHEFDPNDMKSASAIAREHMKILSAYDPLPIMLELEFPDEPLEKRFIRFGTDKDGMVNPVALTREQFRRTLKHGTSDEDDPN